MYLQSYPGVVLNELCITINPVKTSEGWEKYNHGNKVFLNTKKLNLPKPNSNITFIFSKQHKNIEHTLKYFFFYTQKSGLKAIITC